MRLMPSQLFAKTDSDEDGRKYEKPWHRQAALLTAAGWSPSQVADFCQVSPQTVREVLRTRWFQEQVTLALEANGGADMIKMFQAECLNAHITLCELRDSPETPPAVRANICTGMLERVYGKATQRIETNTAPRSTDPVQEVARLEAENNRLRDSVKPSLS